MGSKNYQKYFNNISIYEIFIFIILFLLLFSNFNIPFNSISYINSVFGYSIMAVIVILLFINNRILLAFLMIIFFVIIINRTQSVNPNNITMPPIKIDKSVKSKNIENKNNNTANNTIANIDNNLVNKKTLEEEIVENIKMVSFTQNNNSNLKYHDFASPIYSNSNNAYTFQ